MKIRLKVALILAVVMAAVLLPSTAQASHDDSGTVITTGAKGTVSINWASRTRADPVNFRLFDTACDGRGVYLYFRVYTSGTDWDTQRRENYNGCNTDQSWNSYINDFNGISGIRMIVCRDDGVCNNQFWNNPHY